HDAGGVNTTASAGGLVGLRVLLSLTTAPLGSSSTTVNVPLPATHALTSKLLGAPAASLATLATIGAAKPSWLFQVSVASRHALELPQCALITLFAPVCGVTCSVA